MKSFIITAIITAFVVIFVSGVLGAINVLYYENASELFWRWVGAAFIYHFVKDWVES